MMPRISAIGLSQNLPRGDFEWVSPSEVVDLEILPPDEEKGYILEVDLEFEFPDELHDTHNAYPLAPERRKVELRCLITNKVFSKSCMEIH